MTVLSTMRRVAVAALLLRLLLLIVLLLTGCRADLHKGRIVRSHAAIAAFKRQQPCPATGSSKGACPGWVIDHVKPLACGGADDPSNMQWQTAEEGKAKDRWELKGPGCPGRSR